MSFTLKSIELKNIRAHEHLLFEPALTGITAISGDNGAGKSTIVDAFAWGLYGTRPSGVRNKNLIKDGVDPKDKTVSVRSVIVMGGIEYAIERKIINAQGTVECNVWGKQPGKTEFTQVAGPSVSHVEKFLKSELGMNEKGFLTSIFVQQKQVDQIVSATPRERGAVIEDLTGIASITQAIQKTNETTRSLEKAISIFQVGDVEEVEERVEKQEKVCEEISIEKEKAITLFNENKEKYKVKNADFEIEKSKVTSRKNLEQQIENLTGQVKFLKQQSEEDLKYIENFNEKYGTTIDVNSLELKGEVDSKRKESYEAKNKLSNLNKELSLISKSIDRHVELKGEFKTQKSAKEHLGTLKSNLVEKEKELEDAKDKKAMLTSELKHSKDSHRHLDGEDKNCPVCKSSIDNPEELRKEIETEIEDFKNEQKLTNALIKELTVEIKTIKEELVSTDNALEAIIEEKRLLKEQKEIKSELETINEEESILKEELKSLEAEYDKALRIEADKNALDTAKERSLTVNTRIKNSNAKIEDIKKEIKELNSLTDDELNILEDKINSLRDSVTKMSIAGRELMGRDKLELERLEDARKRLEEVQQAVEKYDEISNQIEVSSSAATMLTAFKADRIEHAIPTLEFYASDFLSKFTGGDFSKLSMDEKFNTFVTTASGHVRPVAQLSGGELSSAAIALRLGISMLLNASDNNVLILDEVLVSMDEDRSRQIMETIGSMTNSQIIFIAHNTDINSVADKTVLVSKTPREE